MVIAFTGHRDAHTAPASLDEILRQYPGAVWRHGGARGFDSQVSAFACARGIAEEVIKPDYKSHDRAAPLIRNRQIVAGAALVVACYDGRQSGGTAFTVAHARRVGVQVVLVPVQKHKK